MWNFTLKLLFSTLPRVSFCFTVQGSIVKWSTLGHLTLTQKISFQESSYSFRLTRILYMTWQMVSLAQYEVTQNCSISHDSPHHNHIKKDLLSVKKNPTKSMIYCITMTTSLLALYGRTSAKGMTDKAHAKSQKVQ